MRRSEQWNAKTDEGLSCFLLDSWIWWSCL